MSFPFVNIHTHSPLEGAVGLRSVSAGTEGMPVSPCRGCGLSVGIHPWKAACVAPDSLAKVLSSPQVLAVGETGLDMSAAWRATAEVQEKVFRIQLSYAESLKKPVVIHCVRSFEPIMSILAEYDMAGVIFHGFIGSRGQALRAVGRGYRLSFGGRSLRSGRSVEALRAIPLDSLFAETDEGPETIGCIYDSISSFTGVNIDLLKEKLYNNYRRLFPDVATEC